MFDANDVLHQLKKADERLCEAERIALNVMGTQEILANTRSAQGHVNYARTMTRGHEALMQECAASLKNAMKDAQRARELVADAAERGGSPTTVIEKAAALIGIDKTTADAMIQASDDLQISHQALWNLLVYTYTALQEYTVLQEEGEAQ